MYPKVFLEPGTVVAVFVLQAFSPSYLGCCDPGNDAHVQMYGGVSQPGLAQDSLKQSLVSG